MLHSIAILTLLMSLQAAPAEAAARRNTPCRYFDPARPIFTRGADRMADLAFPLILRIGLEEKQDAITVTAPKPFRIVVGDRTVSGNPGEKWTFKIQAAQPAEIEYSAAVKTFLCNLTSDAEAEAASWRARGWPGTRVVPNGALLMNGGQIVHDNRNLIVLAFGSTDPEATSAVLPRLSAEGARPFIVERLLKEPQGIIELTGPQGGPIVSRGPFEIFADGSVRVFQVEHDVGYPFHGRQDRDYAGSIIVMVDRWGKLVAINRVEMEKYLTGVVPCEIDSDAPLEAHKVQAVAARGETLAGYGIRHPADPYDFEASQRDQQYAGLTKETPLGTQSVALTRGEVLKSGTHISETVYSANCGGHTEDADAVWSTVPNPVLSAVPDGAPGTVPSPVTTANVEAFVKGSPDSYCQVPGDAPTNKYRWKVTLAATELDRLVAAKGHRIGRVMKLVPMGRGRSGRLKNLLVVGDRGQVRIDKELPIRQLLGGLRSALFVVKPGQKQGDRPDSYTFTGAGWGHGVGMCQMGARGMARAGRAYLAILTHYFTGTQIHKLY